MNGLVDSELANQREQNSSYAEAYKQSTENYQKTVNDSNALKAAKEKSEKSAKTSGIKLADYYSKSLTKLQKQALKAGKTVDTTGITNKKLLAKLEAYNKKVIEASDASEKYKNSLSEVTIAEDAMNEAAQNAATSEGELAESIIEAESTKFDNIKNYYEQQMNYQSLLNEQEEKAIELSQAHGNYKQLSDYDKQIAHTQTMMGLAQDKAVKLQEQLNSSVASGVVLEGSEEWLELKTQIVEAENSAKDYGIQIENLNQEALTVKYAEMFDRAIDKAAQYISKLETINGLITDEMLYDYDSGQLTEMGMLSLALNKGDLDRNINNLQLYVKKRQEIINDYNAGKFGEETFNEKMKEVESNIQSYISAVDSARNKVLTIIKNQSKAELDAIEKVIDARKDALKSKKDYDDYDKSLKNKNKEINALKMQIAALNDVTTAEEKAKKARLEAELADKQDDLDETVKDHVYELQVSGLDKLSEQLNEDYEKYVHELSSNLEKMTEAINNATSSTAENTAQALSLMGDLLKQYGVTPEQVGIQGFAKGTNYVPHSGTYLTDENGSEIIVTPRGVMRFLNRGDEVLNADLASNIYDMAESYPLWKDMKPQVIHPRLDLLSNNKGVGGFNPVIECPITIMGNADEQDVIKAVKKTIPLISKTIQSDMCKEMKKFGY